MRIPIYYFSGTGNSLMIAKNIAAELQGAEVLSIAELIGKREIDVKEKCIGIIFPLYYQVVPVIVQEFIKRLQFHEDCYVFSVVTCGYRVGISMNLISELLMGQGVQLAAGFHIKMPYNFIINGIGLKPPTEQRQKHIFDKAKKQITHICKIICNREQVGIIQKPFVKHIHPYSRFNEEALANALRHSAKNFSVGATCNSCGLCRRICPVQNIMLIDGKPQWNDKCEQCLACINWCPQKAIEFGNVTQKINRYHNPNISAKELYYNKETASLEMTADRIKENT